MCNTVMVHKNSFANFMVSYFEIDDQIWLKEFVQKC